MSKLIKYLKSFNRKERFILLEKALDTFRLSDDFRKELGDHLGLAIPDSAYVAMDYQIGWIQMAVYLENNGEVQKDCIPITEEIKGINDNPQDVDLLVAFTEKSVTHLVLIEAKADTPWNYGQLNSKVKRLQSVSPSDTLKLYFVLMSPSRLPDPSRIEWTAWMKKDGDIPYIPLPLPSNLCKITRWNKKKMPKGEYEYYKIERRSKVEGNC